MKKRIIQLTIAFTGLVASFLPQKAEAFSFCSIECINGSCLAIGWDVHCGCDANGDPVCSA